MTISIIAALSENRVIGKNNDLPWHLPHDMKFFTEITKNHHVIMGRKNYESIPEKYRPLPHRTNIVVTRQVGYHAPGCIVVNSVEEGIAIAQNTTETEAFIIGGAEIYKQSLHFCQKLYLTEIKAEIEGDVLFPNYNKEDWEEFSRIPHSIDEQHPYSFDFVIYKKKLMNSND